MSDLGVHYTQFEDPDEIHWAAWCAIDRWRSTVEPFVAVGHEYVRSRMASDGQSIAGYLDKEASEAQQAVCSARSRRLYERFAEMVFEIRDVSDHVASGW